MTHAAQMSRHILTALLATPFIGSSMLAAQATADFETEEASAALRLSNPWTPDAEALAKATAPPSGRLSNPGSEPVFFLVFVQPALGFEGGDFHLTEGSPGIEIRSGTVSVDPAAPPRAVWLKGVVPPGGHVDLETLAPVAGEAVYTLFREGRAQIAFLVAARRGPVTVTLRDFSPLGPAMPDPTDRGLLYPVHIQLEGTHDLSAESFTAPGPDEQPHEGRAEGADDMRPKQEEE